MPGRQRATERDGRMKWSLAGAMIDARELLGLARAAEEAGYDSIRMPDDEVIARY
jgi:hypothetical protein